MDDFAYFKIRIRRESGEQSPEALSGMIERIGTGDKRSFTSGDELMRFMCGTESPKGSLPIAGQPRNVPDSGSSPRKP